MYRIYFAVFNGSKILIWKQITTELDRLFRQRSCFQWFKDTNLKANHNLWLLSVRQEIAVFNGSKILIWKQITTWNGTYWKEAGCFQWFKDTNLKANHNFTVAVFLQLIAVFNGSKILIWKQITTKSNFILPPTLLFSMVQRY